MKTSSKPVDLAILAAIKDVSKDVYMPANLRTKYSLRVFKSDIELVKNTERKRPTK
jgi:hypothetical protein